VEASREDVGDDEDEDEVLDCGGVVMKAVIEPPMRGERVEYGVLDFPAFVADLAELARGEERLGDAGGPEPVGDLFALDPLARHAFAPRPVLLGARDAKGRRDGTAGEAFLVPVADEAAVLLAPRVGFAHEKGFGVGEQRGVVVLQDGQEVFAVLAAELEERRLPVKGVALNGRIFVPLPRKEMAQLQAVAEEGDILGTRFLAIF